MLCFHTYCRTTARVIPSGRSASLQRISYSSSARGRVLSSAPSTDDRTDPVRDVGILSSLSWTCFVLWIKYILRLKDVGLTCVTIFRTRRYRLAVSFDWVLGRRNNISEINHLERNENERIQQFRKWLNVWVFVPRHQDEAQLCNGR